MRNDLFKFRQVLTEIIQDFLALFGIGIFHMVM